MTKFKVGDKVRVISVCSGAVLKVGDEVEVDFISGSLLYPKGNHRGAMFESRFELVEETHFPLYSEEAAVKLLTERGYEVKAPPEPLRGKVYIYKYLPTGKVFAYDEETWLTNDYDKCEDRVVIAIVDWTEGQGI